MLTRRLSGPMGLHGARMSHAWAYALATLSWVICMLRQSPCRQALPSDSPDRFGWMCYSDITALFFSRGQGTGAVPYFGMNWEYPVLTGYFATIAGGISQIFGAVLNPSADGQQVLNNANIYFAVNAVGLFLCLLWLVASILKIAPNYPVLAMVVAISPAIWTTGLINWDLLVVALTAAGLASWVRDKPMTAGLWWGLAIAAKFYPLVIVGALAVLCVRPDAWRTRATLKAWLKMAAVAVVTWVVVNLPVMVTNMTGWQYFYNFNYASRQADLGSFWYALSLAGIHMGSAASIWSRVIMLLGYVGLALLIYFAPKTPTAPQIAYLAVTVMIVGNLVYSPQYVLWVLPLIVLARPKVLDLTIFTVSELIYFAVIWMYLRQDNLTLGIPAAPWTGPGAAPIPWIYVLAILLRIAATIWVMTRVARDCLSKAPPAQRAEEAVPLPATPVLAAASPVSASPPLATS